MLEFCRASWSRRDGWRSRWWASCERLPCRQLSQWSETTEDGLRCRGQSGDWSAVCSCRWQNIRRDQNMGWRSQWSEGWTILWTPLRSRDPFLQWKLSRVCSEDTWRYVCPLCRWHQRSQAEYFLASLWSQTCPGLIHGQAFPRSSWGSRTCTCNLENIPPGGWIERF